MTRARPLRAATCLLLVLLMLFSLSFAETVTVQGDVTNGGRVDVNTDDAGNKTYTVTYGGLTTGIDATGEAMVWVIKGTYETFPTDAIAADATMILYVNQDTAENQQVLFTNIIPMAPNGSTVFVSGGGRTTPIKIGVIEAGRLRGDVYFDEKINGYDIMYFRFALAGDPRGNSVKNSSGYSVSADIDSNGKVNLYDIMYLRFALANDPRYPRANLDD